MARDTFPKTLVHRGDNGPAYVNEIIVPYDESQRDSLEDLSQAALVIMDNFKGHAGYYNHQRAHNINVYLLRPNTTDLLQPMDIAVNKPAKDFLKQKFEHWYSDEVMKQFQWLVEVAEYIADNPIGRAGIPSALDGSEEVENTGEDSDKLSDEDYDYDEDFSLDSE